MRMATSGNTPRSSFDLVFHFRDLERLGLVDAASGDALIRPSDRLGALYARDGALVQGRAHASRSLYVTEARPIGFGLHRRRPNRNLLLVSFQDRAAARREHDASPRLQRPGRPLPRRTADPSMAASGRGAASSNTAEICDADGSYHELADCDDVSERSSAPFVCAYVDETTEDGHITGHLRAASDDAAAGGGR